MTGKGGNEYDSSYTLTVWRRLQLNQPTIYCFSTQSLTTQNYRNTLYKIVINSLSTKVIILTLIRTLVRMCALVIVLCLFDYGTTNM